MRPRRFELGSRDPAAVRALAREVRALAEGPPDVAEAVAAIVRAVRERGDEAVVELTRRFDSNAAPGDLRVPPPLLAEAADALDPAVRAGLKTAIANVGRLAAAEAPADVAVEMPEGQQVAVQELPVRRAGAYVPGGRAAYPSSVVMCCVPARAAGVEQVVVATPPGADGRGNPVILAACALCGVDEVHLMGGAQAIAALAYGTATVDAVDVIVGPGNAYVQEAKRQVCGQVGIDGIAGPSELLVVAGAGADAHTVALDLAAQAEHGPDSLVGIVSPSEELLDRVAAEVADIASRCESVQDAPLALVRVPGLEAGIDVANELAPEHLELPCEEAERLAGAVRASGCVFVGAGGGAAFGDYAAGSNHVLPTGGAARFGGPLGAGVFRRRQALVSLPADAARALAPHVASVARAEGFPVHAESAEARVGSP